MTNMEKQQKYRGLAMNRLPILIAMMLYTAVILAQETPADNEKLTWKNEIGMEFRLIEPGSMRVGRVEIECPEAPDTRDVDEETRWTAEDFELCRKLAKRHSRPGFVVTIKEPYYIGKYEVTQEQWQKVMGTNPSFFQGDSIESANGQPVESVTWEQAQDFTKKLSELDPNAEYRLPTEFEWEYAARAGNEKLLSWAETKERAWIQDTNKGSPQLVGLMEPNAWGLYDMLGNVWEWVEDYYNNKTFADPVPPESGEVHVLKGGSFISDVVNATYFNHSGGPGNTYDVGFRVVKEVE